MTNPKQTNNQKQCFFFFEPLELKHSNSSSCLAYDHDLCTIICSVFIIMYIFHKTVGVHTVVIIFFFCSSHLWIEFEFDFGWSTVDLISAHFVVFKTTFRIWKKSQELNSGQLFFAPKVQTHLLLCVCTKANVCTIIKREWITTIIVCRHFIH